MGSKQGWRIRLSGPGKPSQRAQELRIWAGTQRGETARLLCSPLARCWAVPWSCPMSAVSAFWTNSPGSFVFTTAPCPWLTRYARVRSKAPEPFSGSFVCRWAAPRVLCVYIVGRASIGLESGLLGMEGVPGRPSAGGGAVWRAAEIPATEPDPGRLMAGCFVSDPLPGRAECGVGRLHPADSTEHR